MSRIRVLIVDDSVVVRRVLTDALTQDPDLEIVGLAANGNIALQKLSQCNPDVVTLDIEMPDLDGLETLKRLRVTYPRLPVIMFSTLTHRGCIATLDALSLGASDYVTKPSNSGSLAEAIKRIQQELIPKIKALCTKKVELSKEDHPPAPATPLRPQRQAELVVKPQSQGTADVAIVAIGTSTGGPNALADLVPVIPGDFPVPIVIVQHMPPLFTKLLAERLNTKSEIGVHEGEPGIVLQKGHAYLAPGDFHMVLQRRGSDAVLALNQDPPENSCRPAVDVLFRSVVKLYGKSTLGVILTGMGQDGLRGCELIREAGGQILTQDEASSVIWGMPGFVARAGLADRVLPLSLMGKEIVHRAMSNTALKL